MDGRFQVSPIEPYNWQCVSRVLGCWKFESDCGPWYYLLLLSQLVHMPVLSPGKIINDITTWQCLSLSCWLRILQVLGERAAVLSNPRSRSWQMNALTRFFFCYSLRACITKTFHIVKQENITLPRDRHQYSCVISFHPVLGSWYSFFFIIINYGVVFPGVYCCLPTFYGSKKKKSQIGMFCGWARGKLLQISSVLIPPWPNNVSIVFNESR